MKPKINNTNTHYYDLDFCKKRIQAQSAKILTPVPNMSD